MGQPRPPDAPDLDEAKAFGTSFGEAWEAWRKHRTPTPIQVREPQGLTESLKAQADRADREAIAEGRKTPRPRSPLPDEEKTTCLVHHGREPESLARVSSKPGTEEELSAGELSRLAKMAADDRAILEERRLQKLTPISKGRT